MGLRRCRGPWKVGEEYVLQKGRKRDAPIQRVKLLQHIRVPMWKAEWIDPNPGLVEYVQTKNLIVEWKHRKAYYRDEDAERGLQEHAKERGWKRDSPIDNALTQVFESVSDGMTFWKAKVTCEPDSLERVRARAKFDPTKASSFN